MTTYRPVYYPDRMTIIDQEVNKDVDHVGKRVQLLLDEGYDPRDLKAVFMNEIDLRVERKLLDSITFPEPSPEERI